MIVNWKLAIQKHAAVFVQTNFCFIKQNICKNSPSPPRERKRCILPKKREIFGKQFRYFKSENKLNQR